LIYGIFILIVWDEIGNEFAIAIGLSPADDQAGFDRLITCQYVGDFIRLNADTVYFDQ
jgi:hypothetical protein